MALSPSRRHTLVLAATSSAAKRGLSAMASTYDVAVVVATAAAFVGVQGAVDESHQALEGIAERFEDVVATSRHDWNAQMWPESASVLWLCQGSGLHLKSVVHDAAAFEALAPELVVAIGESAMAISDPMVDPRGGAPTLGLGLERRFSVLCGEAVAHAQRTRELLAPHHGLVALGDDGWLLVQGEQVTSENARWIGDVPEGLSLR
jgi:hypothetical protein